MPASMVRLALNSTETHQNAGPSSSPSGTFSPNSDSGMPAPLMQHHHPNHNHNHHPPVHQPQSMQQQHGPPPLPQLQHHHMHHENGVGLYVPYTGEFYPADHGYFIPHDMCPTHAPMCLHSDFGKNYRLFLLFARVPLARNFDDEVAKVKHLPSIDRC